MSPRRNGFTLVEMAVALAVLAFAMVTLIGLLAVGLSSQKSSTEDTRLAAMVGYVISTERMRTFVTVSNPSYTTNYYFDIQGNTNTQSASYLRCTVTNVSSSNSSILGGTNIATMQAVFVYPWVAGTPLSAGTKTNVFFYNRSNN